MPDFKVTKTIKFTRVVEAENSEDALAGAMGLKDEHEDEQEINWKTKKVISKE